ncbi:penicillin-binding protein activator [Sphingomonas sp. ID1715]|uniref:penicillin-binding protein activator n=1 Tax=Sphingomonas sp. ID1715 TaxID=1656898 RepID=UPI001488F886|nr:penicillin-binding protein activator [Sphingomonas sp. ID1715]NNM76041.1 penicillin-binding protein activator [Sphingomonas sp. ID1715]
MAEAATAPQIWAGAAKKLGLATGLLALAACQTMVPRRGPQAPTPTPTPVETPRPIGPELPDDAERNRIALLVPLSGPNAAVGQSIANAANLAVLDTGGKRIRITTYDTGAGASGAATRAINEGNKIILGPLLAEEVRLVAPVAQRSRVPVISFSNDTSVAGNGVFVMGYTPAESIDRVVRFARAKGMTKFAGLTPTGVYGQRAANAFLRSVESAGGQVVTLQSFDRSKGGISAAITKMGANSPYEAVLIADGARTASQAVTLLRKGAPSAKVLGTELWNTEGAISTMTPLHGAWFASVPDGLYRQLSAKYRARFSSAPYRISSMGYDAVLLVSRIAQDWRLGSDFPMVRLVDNDGFTGIDGPFRFRRDGVVERALEVSQVGPNGQTVVSPPPARFDD